MVEMDAQHYKAEQKFYFIEVARSLLHTPYSWGGDDPSGFDCSGLVVECLKSVGILRGKEDLSANGLWQKYSELYECKKPKRGALAFWLNDSGKAYHVAICLSDQFCLTADGGGSFMVPEEPPAMIKTIFGRTMSRYLVRILSLWGKAIERNAFTKIRPIDHRKAKPKYINLFK